MCAWYKCLFTCNANYDYNLLEIPTIKKIMTKKLLFYFTLMCLISVKANSNEILPDPKKENKILEIVYNVMKSKHLVSKKIDDNFSKKIFKTYLDSIDKYKMFFRESDIKEFKKYESKLDDDLKNNDLTFFFMTHDRLIKRMIEGKDMYSTLLKSNVDFSVDENTNFVDVYSSKNTPTFSYKKNKAEQLKQWTNLIKTFFLSRYTNEFINVGNSNCKEFEAFIVSKKINLTNIFDSTFYNFENITRDRIFEFYVNSIVVQFDPHSRYYVPTSRDLYLQNQTGKIEGAGITVNLANSFIEVKKMADSGPAWMSKKIDVGDVILKIAQGKEEAVNVVGYNIFDVTKLLKGKSGSIVRVVLKKPDGKIVEVSLKRAVINSNDNYIKSSIVLKNNIKYGLICFPRFYTDFDDDMVRNVTDDFEDELEVLKKSDVQGIVIDIRNNGGGSVEAAIRILSNFIGKNPIVQVKNKEQLVTTFESEQLNKIWDKSAVLLINSETASAAEILAASFQEYNLGVIVGETSFGKGTIQEFLDLNSFNRKKDENVDFGALKITTQKFYKLNGKPIQKKGIIPDVKIADSQDEVREIDVVNVLNTDEVKAINHKPIYDLNTFQKIVSNNQSRINQYFNSGKLNGYKYANFPLKSLNLKKIQVELEGFLIKRSDLMKQKYRNNLEFTLTIADVKLLKKKEYLLQKRKDWLDDLPNDYHIEESLNVLEDMTRAK